ncbi:MAG: rod shape-determining protein MreD [Legionellales bacterium]|nr:rod shape-determining protein MreD [Legionellales bacterium]|tara:strand:+ start:91425 stop:91916 length:492 start_codon:yes stop_codon:yes gene_type:complete
MDTVQKKQGTGWIILSFVIALMLDVLPLPNWAEWFRPEWMVMVLIFWVLVLPQRVNVGVAWVVGLVLDVVNNAMIGEHALACVLVAYITIKLHRRIRVFPMSQQILVVLGLLWFYQLVIFILQGVIGQPMNYLLYWLPSFVGMLLWPWLFVILRDWRTRFAIS